MKIKINRNIRVKILEKTNSGKRFLELEGKIIKKDECFININGYIININDIVKWQTDY